MAMVWTFLARAALLGQIAAATQLRITPNEQRALGTLPPGTPLTPLSELDKEKDHDFAIGLFSHYKCGTSLMLQLSEYLGAAVNVKQLVVQWNQAAAWNSSAAQIAVCTPNAIMQWDQIQPGALQRLLKECPKLRGVHMVRAPTAAVASSYVYMNKFTPGSQYDQNSGYLIHKGLEYRSHSVAYGVRDACNSYYYSHLPGLLATYEYIRDQGLESQILQMKYEEFEEDFDKATRKVFTHIFANFHGFHEYPDIDALVLGAQKLDPKRWSPQRHLASPHVAEASEKDQAFETEKMELARKNECQQKLAADDAALGYPPRF